MAKIRDYDQNPFIVIWEATRMCPLHCMHCRAAAQLHPYPGELTTDQGKQLIDQVYSMDNPLFVFSGGDPLMRDDIYELIEYANNKGMRVSITPSATPRLTRKNILRAKEAGIARWALSLDGPDAETHDYFRGFSGTFDRTMKTIDILNEEKIPFQVNTTVTQYNVDKLPEIAELMAQHGAVVWTLFFLVPTGRGELLQPISPERHDEVMHWAFELQEHAPFIITTTEGQFYRRVMYQENEKRRAQGLPVIGHFADDLAKAPRGTNDGNGFIFVGHTGEVEPSGFLPLTCGNVKETPLPEIYRKSPILRTLRDPDSLKGKCGVCEFRYMCSGSRARAYAVTGDYQASDPYCTYIPQRLREKKAVNSR
ncbi:TIGR04053 family radical SAM/SPASM domain-containing protein [Sporolactobacillus shoreae]|uniref:TIGR04053 family radical SAM/SPASM domain-containing protein n=1 Tax=Sporolactobacillus shoreae TaxID=1465501 RepID=A0A4Z0GNW4_9BACL|nr:TIGR04053 family radical SAM/SPASM domain-containing protein [Sporolactobacillus shoreae]TGA98880.1 TIGR04053 family radical SAM/SPASM domain-containing protein [Sporolactobacillus shoreae]